MSKFAVIMPHAACDQVDLHGDCFQPFSITAACGCIFISGYILLAVAMFADSPLLLIFGFVILLASFFQIRKLDPATLKGCASTGIVSVFGFGFLIAFLFRNVNSTALLFAILFTPTGLFLIKASRLSATDVFKGVAYLKKSHKEIKDRHSK
jgi:hypothetical protein